MKRKLILLVVFGLMFGLVACGDELEKETENQPTPTVVKTEDSNDTATETKDETVGTMATPTETPTPTPTPEIERLVYEGPSFVIGSAEPYTWWDERYQGETDVFTSNVDLIYLTEKGYDNLALTIREINRANCDECKGFWKDTKSILEDVEPNEEITGGQWFCDIQTKMERCDSAVFSFSGFCESYLGGAHPYGYRKGYNLDTQTGRILQVSDVITDKEKFTELVTKAIPEKTGSVDVLSDGWEKYVSEKIEKDELSFVLTDDGMEIWFNSGEIASYAEDEIAITISVTDQMELFREEYLGAYGNRKVLPREKETPVHSKLVEDVLKTAAEGITKMTFEESEEFIKKGGWQYDTIRPEDFYDSDPQIYIVDEESGESLYIFFWHLTESDPAYKSIGVWYYDKSKGTHIVYDTDYFDRTKLNYQIVDYVTASEMRIAVSFNTWQDALSVNDVTWPEYYPDMKDADK